MVKRIEPATDALAARERKAVEDIRALFPDGNVSGLDTKDKSLGKRLSKLYVALGYESRKDMIEALGFTQVQTNFGGRPVMVDPEAVLAELQRRYDGKQKPDKVSQIIADNPDLKGSIKTLSNKAKELFGQTFAKELVKRGILDSPSIDRLSISDEDIRAAVFQLEEKYAHADEKPNSMKELKELEPEYADIIDALVPGRSSKLFGESVAAYFKRIGILKRIDDAEILAAIDALAELLKDVKEDDKPKSIDELCSRYPDYSNLIIIGKRRHVLTKGSLQDRGIVRDRKKDPEKEAERQRLLGRKLCVRNATPDDLALMYAGNGGSMLILPDDDRGYLRSGVIGLDILAGCELRETTFLSFEAENLEVGDALSIYYPTSDRTSDDWWFDKFKVKNGEEAIVSIRRPHEGDFLYCQPFATTSKLETYAGTTVDCIEKAGDRSIVRIRHRFLCPITNETMLYALYHMGAITEAELLGDNSWRDRLNAMPSLHDIISAKQVERDGSAEMPVERGGSDERPAEDDVILVGHNGIDETSIKADEEAEKAAQDDESAFLIEIHRQFDKNGIPVTVEYDACRAIIEIRSEIDGRPRIAPAKAINDRRRGGEWAILDYVETVGVKPECLTSKNASEKILNDFLKAAKFVTSDIALESIVAAAPVKKDGHLAANRNALEITMDGVFEDATTWKLIGKTDKNDGIEIYLKRSKVDSHITAFGGNTAEYLKQNSIGVKLLGLK